MTKTKSTKRALLSSVLALIMCFSMLVGSTFAWFTDSVSNANNIIQSGNLDIELWHCNNNQTQWGFGYNETNGEEIKGDTALFLNIDGKPILWEPGAGAGETFRVKNAGTLALKYQFRIRAFDITQTAEGKDLTDILSMQVIELENNENGVPVGVTGGVNYEALFGDGYVIKGELLPGETADYNVAIDWHPSAIDNEFNVKGGLKLTFGVDLIATQLTYEKDSFGDQYDKDAAKEGIRVEENNMVFIHAEDGEIFLERVLPGYTDETLIIPNGVTSIGWGSETTGGVQVFSTNTSVKNVIFPSTVRNIGYQAFKDSAVESVTLNEGLEEIGEFAFNGAKNLKSFNIPSTVKVIGKRAFRSTAATELTIPAGVESIDESFRDMANLTKVTIEGNTYIGNYAFRQCASLREVYLLGDDVTIGTNMAFANASSNNPGTNNITFYVQNDVVASRVKTAMGVGTDFYIYIND